MSDRRVLRYEVPVDDEWHRINISGEIIRVGSRKSGVVEFWAVDPVLRRAVTDGMGGLISVEYENVDVDCEWLFRVFGTGQEAEGLCVGTTYDGVHSELVWHLFRREVII